MSSNDSKKRSSQPPSVQKTVQTEQKSSSSSSSSTIVPINSDASFLDAAKRYKTMPETSVSVIQDDEKELIAAISKLKSYITNSSFSSNVDQRDRHSLIKGTLASFGKIGEDVKNLTQAVGIQLAEDLGDAVVVDNDLVASFKDSKLDDSRIKNDKVKDEAAKSLLSLIANTVSFSALPQFIDGNDSALLYCHYHYVRHIHSMIYHANIVDGKDQLRIGQDHRNDLSLKLKAFCGINASNLFVDLFEKIIEKLVMRLISIPETKQAVLNNLKTHIITLGRSYEKNLPKIQKMDWTDSDKKVLQKNPNKKLDPRRKRVVLVPHRPTLDIKGFLTPSERENLHKFNVKLNSVSSHFNENQITLEVGARRKFVQTFQRLMVAKIAVVQRTISRRKNLIYNKLNSKRASFFSEEEIKERKPFIPAMWNDEFKQLDKSDLKNALIIAFGTDKSELLDLNTVVPEWGNSPTFPSSKIASSDSEQGIGNENNNIDVDD
jgi:hypothetical protein